MKKLFFLGIICFCNCTSKHSNYIPGANELFSRFRSNLIVIDSSDGEILEMIDKTDSIAHGDYAFFKNGNLKSYKFFTTKHSYDYDEEFNINGDLISVEGNPFVYYHGKLLGTDSLFFTVYFFSLNKTYKQIQITSNCKHFFSSPLQKDSIYTNMLSAKYGINIKNINDIVMYLNCEYQNQYSKKIEKFKDTIGLNYTPPAR